MPVHFPANDSVYTVHVKVDLSLLHKIRDSVGIMDGHGCEDGIVEGCSNQGMLAMLAGDDY